MILYFSGTGNSEYVAKRIGEAAGDEILDLFDKIRNHDFSEMCSNRPWVIVTPTYAWRIPRVVQAWLEKTKLSGSEKIYFVMTCGDDIGSAGKYLEAFCASKQLKYSGCYSIVMPENYIAMFPTPDKEEALKIIHQAEGEIDKVIDFIKDGKSFPQVRFTIKDKICSGIVNDVFYPIFVHAKQFYVKESCISCGKCEVVCPLNNIRIENGKPVWGKDCTHCMACISYCPKVAIEYGRHSKEKPRYTFQKGE